MKPKHDLSKHTSKLLILKLAAAAMLSALIITLSALKNSVYVSEYIFTRGLSRGYMFIMSKISLFFPFSLYELFIAVCLALLVMLIINSIKRLKRRHFRAFISGLLSLAVTVLSIVSVYIMTASFSYNRESVDLHIDHLYTDPDKLPDIAAHFLDDFNQLSAKLEKDASGSVINPYSFATLASLCRDEYIRFAGDSFYNSSLPAAKSMVFSEVMSRFHISGVFFAPLAEPNINTNAPAAQLPVTILHELAHAAGVMHEREANYIAYYLALNSQNDFIRYSGYVNTFYSFLGSASIIEFMRSADGTTPRADELYKLVSTDIKTDLNNSGDYWRGKYSFISKITEKINDMYLKISGIFEGTDNYIPSPPDYKDTGEVDEDERPIIDITYSLLQKIYLDVYQNAGYDL